MTIFTWFLFCAVIFYAYNDHNVLSQAVDFIKPNIWNPFLHLLIYAAKKYIATSGCNGGHNITCYSYRALLDIVKSPHFFVRWVGLFGKALLCTSFKCYNLWQSVSQLQNSSKSSCPMCSLTCLALEWSEQFLDFPQWAELERFVKLIQLLCEARLHLLIGGQKVIKEVLLHGFRNISSCKWDET